MTPKEPTTRTQANQPDAVDHLSTSDQSALELSAEVEHTDGTLREQLTVKAARLTKGKKENGDR